MDGARTAELLHDKSRLMGRRNRGGNHEIYRQLTVRPSCGNLCRGRTSVGNVTLCYHGRPAVGCCARHGASPWVFRSDHRPRGQNLRWSATVGEMMSAIRTEGGADSGAISLSVPEIGEFKNGRFTHKVSFRDFHFLNRPQITRMLMIDWLTGILGWSAAFLLFSDASFALTVALAGLLAVHIARIAWLVTPTQFDADTP